MKKSLIYILPAAAGAWHLLDVLMTYNPETDGRILSLYMFILFIGIALPLYTADRQSLPEKPAFMLESLFTRKSPVKPERFYNRRNTGAGFAFILIFMLGSLYGIVLPPLSAPDEISHYISAYQLSSRLLLKNANSEDGHVLIRAGDIFIEDVYGEYMLSESAPYYNTEPEHAGTVLSRELDKNAYRLIYAGEAGDYMDNINYKSGEAAVSSYPPVRTSEFIYLPQALGIVFARLAGLDSILLLYSGRLMNLLFFAVLIAYSIKIIPFYKELLSGIALLPMTLHLASSFSYDAMIIAGVSLYIAACLRLRNKENIGFRDMIILLVLAAVVFPCKMVYMPVLGLFLIIPAGNFGKKWKAVVYGILILAVWIAAMYIINTKVIVQYTLSGENIVEWAMEPGYSMGFIKDNPLKTLRLLYNTVLKQGDFYFISMLGGYLGNLDEVLDIPFIITGVLFASLTCLCVQERSGLAKLKRYERLIIIIICAGCTLAIMLSMLLAWTPLSAEVIEGVQGRYFLPVLLLVFAAFRGEALSIKGNISSRLINTIVICNVYALLRIYGTVCLRV